MTVYINEHKFVFYHIPKAGGTSIRKWFQKNTTCEYYNFPGFSHITPDLFLKIEPDLNYSLCVVRNPWDRTVSSYRFFMKHQEKIFRKYNKSYFPAEWKKLNGLTNLSNISFSDYLNLCNKNNHFLLIDLAQKRYVKPKNHKNNIILRYEGLNEDFKIVQDFFKCNDPLPHFHKTYNEIPYQNYYDQKSIDIVNEKYKKDIEYFQYSFE